MAISKIFVFNEERIKRMITDPTLSETHVFHLKYFSVKQRHLRATRKAPPHPNELLLKRNTAFDDSNTAEFLNTAVQFFNCSEFTPKTKQIHMISPKKLLIQTFVREQIIIFLQDLVNNEKKNPQLKC